MATDLASLKTIFNPRMISGLEAWYDASAISSITIQTGVQQWADLSGNSRHLIQNTTNSQPLYNSVTLNNRPTLTFDGSNDSLRTAAFTIAQPFTFFAIFRFESAYVSGAPRIIDGGNQTSGWRAGEIYRQAENDIRMYNSPGGGLVVGNVVPAGQVRQFNVWDFEFSGATSRLRYRTNVYTATGSIGTNSLLRITVGGDSNTTALSNSNISVAEILLFSRTMPTNEAAAIRRYLGAKYGLTYQ